MRATLKGLHSPDAGDLQTFFPDEADNFGILIQATIGPSDSEGGESFDSTLCTPQWLLTRYKTPDMLLGLHKTIVFEYHYPRLAEFIEKFLMCCDGDNWVEVSRNVRLLGQWEFENYRSAERIG